MLDGSEDARPQATIGACVPQLFAALCSLYHLRTPDNIIMQRIAVQLVLLGIFFPLGLAQVTLGALTAVSGASLDFEPTPSGKEPIGSRRLGHCSISASPGGGG